MLFTMLPNPEAVKASALDTDWMQKDLHLASVSAYEAGVAMPVVNVTKEIYRLAMRHGLADLDFSVVYRVLNTTENSSEDIAQHEVLHR